MFPFIAWLMSASEGFGFCASSADADMIGPAWQWPHCGTSTSCHARWTGCDPSADRPSMVVTGAPAACDTIVWHDRTARPRRCTVHAPHWPIPHPNLVPLRFRTSRMAHNRGMSPGTSTIVVLPLTVNANAISCAFLREIGGSFAEVLDCDRASESKGR